MAVGLLSLLNHICPRTSGSPPRVNLTARLRTGLRRHRQSATLPQCLPFVSVAPSQFMSLTTKANIGLGRSGGTKFAFAQGLANGQSVWADMWPKLLLRLTAYIPFGIDAALQVRWPLAEFVPAPPDYEAHKLVQCAHQTSSIIRRPAPRFPPLPQRPRLPQEQEQAY